METFVDELGPRTLHSPHRASLTVSFDHSLQSTTINLDPAHSISFVSCRDIAGRRAYPSKTCYESSLKLPLLVRQTNACSLGRLECLWGCLKRRQHKVCKSTKAALWVGVLLATLLAHSSYIWCLSSVSLEVYLLFTRSLWSEWHRLREPPYFGQKPRASQSLLESMFSTKPNQLGERNLALFLPLPVRAECS